MVKKATPEAPIPTVVPVEEKVSQLQGTVLALVFFVLPVLLLLCPKFSITGLK